MRNSCNIIRNCIAFITGRSSKHQRMLQWTEGERTRSGSRKRRSDVWRRVDGNASGPQVAPQFVTATEDAKLRGDSFERSSRGLRSCYISRPLDIYCSFASCIPVAHGSTTFTTASAAHLQ